MSSNSKEIAKLKKKYSKLPSDVAYAGRNTTVLALMPTQLALLFLRKFLDHSDYRLKRESTKFFRLSNRAYGAGKSGKCRRLLDIAIGLLGSDFPISFANLLRNSTLTISKNPNSRGAISESVLVATKQMLPSISDATGWYQLSRGLFSLGYFRAAWVARENSLELSILESLPLKASSTAIIRGIQAHIERRNINEIGTLVQQNEHTLSTKIVSHIEATVSLFSVDHGPVTAVSKIGNELGRDIFRKLITKKSVAIVGPGSPHGSYGSEIDAFDTVIRIKFIGRRMLDANKFHGSRTDISFIGAVGAVKLQEFELQEDFEGFKLFLSNPTNFESVGSVPLYGFEDDAVIYRTPTTAGVRTLKEVLKFAPSRTKLFGFDFYATTTPYSNEVNSFYEKSAWQFGHLNDFIKNGNYIKFMRAADFSEHDPVSNFCFAQNLYKAGLFDIEPYGKSILELTPYQYVERLEEMLGDW